MLKLENIIKKTKNVVLAGGIFLASAFAQDVYAQNVVSGSIKTIPTNVTPSLSRVRLTNISNGQVYSNLTNDGNFSINVPSGTYQREVLVAGNYQVLDTIAVSGAMVLNEKVIESFNMTGSTVAGPVGTSGLKGIKFATYTRDEDDFINGTIRPNVINNPYVSGHLKLFVNRANIPAGYEDDIDAGIADITAKLGPIFTEQSTNDLTEGVSFEFRTTATWPSNVPIGTAATWADVIYPDNNHVKHWTVYFNSDYFLSTPTTVQRATEKELGVRVLSLSDAFGPDFVYLMSAASTTSVQPDEVNIIKRVHSLDDMTVMKKHRDNVIASVPDSFFSSVIATTPDNGLTFNNDKIGQRDPDGDVVNEQVWNFKNANNTPYNSVTNASNIAVSLPQGYFSLQHTQYKANVTLKQKYNNGVVKQTLTSSDITFTTPNILPSVTPNVTSGQNIVWTAGNDFNFTETIADPGEPNALTGKIEFYKGAVKQKEANGTLLNILKSEVIGGATDYFVRFIGSDGVGNRTIDVPVNFSNNPTTFDFKHNGVTMPNNTSIVFSGGIYAVNLLATDPDGAVSGEKITLKETNGTIISQINGISTNLVPIKKGTKVLEGSAVQNGITGTYSINVIFPNNAPSGTSDLTDGQTIAWVLDKYKVNFTSSDLDNDAVSITSKVKQGADVKATASGQFIEFNRLPRGAYTLEYTVNDGTVPITYTKNFNTPDNPTTINLDVLANEILSWDASGKRKVTQVATDIDGPVTEQDVGLYKKTGELIVKNLGTQIDLKKTDAIRGLYDVIATGKENGVIATKKVAVEFPNNVPTIDTILVNYNSTDMNIKSPGADFDNDPMTDAYTINGNGSSWSYNIAGGEELVLPLTQFEGGKDYTITVEKKDNANGKATKTVSTFTPPITGIEPVFDGLKVYPNPFQNQLNIEYNKDLDMRILDIQGREVYHQKINSIDVVSPDISPGMYIIQLNDGKSKYTQKIIKN